MIRMTPRSLPGIVLDENRNRSPSASSSPIYLPRANCALAARRIDPQQLADLRKLLNAMQDAAQSVEQAEAIDQQFHCAVAEASGNSAISATVSWLWQLRNESEISTRFHQRVREEGSRPILADHERILDALADGDGERAREAMASHLQRVVDSLMEAS